MKLSSFYIDHIIQVALEEDINYVDVSADFLFDDDAYSTAYYVAKASGTVCGIDIAMRVFELLDDTFKKKVFVKDGDKVEKGDILAEFSGRTRALLNGERTALNLVQHMSGIATATAKAVAIVEGTGTRIVETRKTLPGLRKLQKYAILCGGGHNHRYNLSDGAMLKDNHIDAGGGITNTLNTLRSKLSHMTKIEVETRTLEEVAEAVQAGADVIMLDNMDNETMKKAIKICKGKAIIEASGNMTNERLKEVADLGVDIISMGELTHSVTAFDISMKIK